MERRVLSDWTVDVGLVRLAMSYAFSFPAQCLSYRSPLCTGLQSRRESRRCGSGDQPRTRSASPYIQSCPPVPRPISHDITGLPEVEIPDCVRGKRTSLGGVTCTQNSVRATQTKTRVHFLYPCGRNLNQTLTMKTNSYRMTRFSVSLQCIHAYSRLD